MERYQIFLDSKTGLVPGTLDLCQTEQGVTGYVTMIGHGTEITSGTIEGNERRFDGTIWYKEQEVLFSADGEVNDEVLELNVHIGELLIPLTGFSIA